MYSNVNPQFEEDWTSLSELCQELAQDIGVVLDAVILDGDNPGLLKGEHALELSAGGKTVFAWMRPEEIVRLRMGKDTELVREKLQNALHRLKIILES